MHLNRLYGVIIVIVLVLAPLLTSAVGVGVRVQVTGEADQGAPSIPQDLTATAVSSSQVNLTWTASTDNVGVVGYQVFRGGVQVATSTITSYADTGLSADTTYTYYLRAFDLAGNYSGDSSAASATTQASDEIGEEDAGSSGSLVLDISNVVITPKREGDNNFATLSFLSNRPALAKVYYGLTSDLEAGVISEIGLSKEHYFVLGNLLPGGRYFLRIELSEAPSVVKQWDYTFTALSAPDTEAPATIVYLRYVIEDREIVLTWRNPTDRDFESVLILRSPHFYPINEENGLPIYRGGGERVVDANNLVPNTKYYYTLFVCDSLANCRAAASITVPYFFEGEVEGEISTTTSGVVVRDFTVHQGDFIDLSIGANQIDRSPMAVLLEVTNPEGDKIDYLMSYDSANQDYVLRRFFAAMAGEYQYEIKSYSGANNSKLVGRGTITVIPRDIAVVGSIKWWILMLIILVVIIWMIVESRRKSHHQHQVGFK